MSYALRWYQQESCDAFWSSLCGQPGNPLIELPTGAGKSIVIAEIARKACQEFNGRVMVSQHRKELIEQNANKIAALLPFGLRCGKYSAGLRRFATDEAVICAGIQSVYKKAEIFGAINLLLIDEAHLVPTDGEGMYRKFIADLLEINPRLKIGGLTATAFRTDCGKLYGPGLLFSHVCYQAHIPRLIADGFLSPLVSRPARESYDTTKLHVRAGEFILREMEDAFAGDASKVERACQEIAAAAAGRRSCMVFCTGVRHAELVAKSLASITGEGVELITGDTPELLRSTATERFKSGKLRWLVNVDVLTTGFDAPGVDCIAVLRATMSAGLFAQICGRGMRTASGKADCLILDFGGNIGRHGPLDSPAYGRVAMSDRSASSDEPQEGPQKECPNCGIQLAAGRKACDCGFKFPPRELKHDDKADGSGQILSAPQTWRVVQIEMAPHFKRSNPDAPPTLRVDYLCQPAGDEGAGNLTEQTISEWVCIEHDPGFAYHKACLWWRAHSRAPMPATVEEAIELWQRGAVATPAEIETVQEGKFHRITAQRIDELPTTWADEVAAVPFDGDSLF
ncbi:MAG: DEAD/DEAH box helicase [Planctomycetes bacterium]|nr:DEAD/DEAH box helicase [Planctomycetota bacterium]